MELRTDLAEAKADIARLSVVEGEILAEMEW